jgi:hypothetical protein
MRKLSNEARKELEGVAAMPDSEIRDWRGKTMAKGREIVHAADPEIVEARERPSDTISFGAQSGSLGAKDGQNFCGHFRALWNTRRISTTLLRTR